MNRFISTIVICILLSSCQEDAAVTGTLQVSIVSDTLDPNTNYALFTEATYLSGQFLPLRQGSVGGKDLIEFKELLPGTYVFGLYTASPLFFTGQVASGKQSQLSVSP